MFKTHHDHPTKPKLQLQASALSSSRIKALAVGLANRSVYSWNGDLENLVSF